MNSSLSVLAHAALAFVLHLGLAQASRAAPQLLPIDVTSTTIVGSFLLEGAPYPTGHVGMGQYETAIFDLGTEAGLRVPLGVGADMSYGPLSIIVGDYTPIFEGVQSSSGQAPEIGPTPLAGPVSIPAPMTLDIDVPAIDVEFEVTLNGGSFPPAGSLPFEDKGYFHLRHKSTGHEIFLGSTQDGTLSARILPGTYEVVYRYSPGNSTGVPQNENAVVADDLLLSSDQTVFVDVPAVEVDISFRLNGSPFPTPNPAGDGRLELRNFESGDSVPYGLTSAGLATRVVIHGTYDATWTRTGSTLLVPQNTTAVVAEGLDIQTAAPLLVDVQAVTITPDLQLDGAPFPISNDDRGEIWLVDAHGNEVALGVTEDLPSGGVFIVAGTYDAWYRAFRSTGTAPINPNARIASGLALLSDQTLPLDVATADVVLTYTLDGGPVPIDDQNPFAFQRCRFALIGEGATNSIDLGENVDPPLDSLRVVAGIYDVEYEWIAGDKLPVNTNQRVVESVVLSAAAVLPVDILSEAVTPSFFLDGIPFPTDPMGNGPEHGHFYLNPPSGETVSLGPSDLETPLTFLLIEGDYDVEYEWSRGTFVPRNPRRHVGAVMVPEPGTAPSLAIGAICLWAMRRHRAGRGPARESARACSS